MENNTNHTNHHGDGMDHHNKGGANYWKWIAIAIFGVAVLYWVYGLGASNVESNASNAQSTANIRQATSPSRGGGGCGV